MEFEVSYDLDNAEQFWDELDEIVSKQCKDHETIDNALRAYLSFTTKYKEDYLQSDYDIAQCIYKLLASAIFKENKEYVRRQLVYCILQEEEASTLQIVASFLHYDGRSDDETLRMMKQEGAFPRLVELVQDGTMNIDGTLHRMLLDLIYEMSRIQRLSWDDLTSVNDSFVLFLFQIIEQISDDAGDPYHYPVIRVLLVLNEQYLVTSTLNSIPVTNRVIKTLSTHGSRYKTFGENLILLLNRESETSLQLLILKLLYLLFCTPSTAEYFYTNDLHVLLDVIMRNLLDLPNDSAPVNALRHTYLRVLHPLLAHSQLRREGMGYKRDDIRRLLRVLGEDANAGRGKHFAPVDATTARLVERCSSVDWIKESASDNEDSEAPSSADGSKSEGFGQKQIAQRILGMSLKEGGESASSFMAVATHQEKPGVKTPSRQKFEESDDEEENGKERDSPA